VSFPSVALGEIAEFIRGVTYKPTDLMDNFSEGSIVCMRTANVQKLLDETNLLSIPRGLVRNEVKILREGDLLVSTANSWNLVGKCCWVPSLNYLATPGGFIAALRGDKSKVDLRYLYHWFNSPDTQADARNCGRQTTNISNMDIGRCLALIVPLPPLPEQRRIAAILDKADALRAKRREAISRLDQLLQSVFLEMFGDPVTNSKGWPIGKISDLLESAKYGSSEKADLQGEVPILRMNNITYSGEMNLTDLKYISKDKAEEKYSVMPGDILFNRTNSKELVGKTAVYEGPTPMAYAGYLVRARTADGHAPEYISAFMNSSYGKSTLQAMCKSIVGMANINAREFQGISIPIPPCELQQSFRSHVKAIRVRKCALELQSQKFDALFNSLQQRFISTAN
jgi:type I restriction enzyme S subunit